MGVRQRPTKSAKSPAVSIKPSSTPSPPAKPTPLYHKVISNQIQITPQEALTSAHWLRQLLGIVIGLVFGIAQFTGAPAVLTFLVATTVLPPFLLSLTNELDLEEIAEISPIQTEGIAPSIALFLLTWIVSYTVCLPPGAIKA